MELPAEIRAKVQKKKRPIKKPSQRQQQQKNKKHVKIEAKPDINNGKSAYICKHTGQIYIFLSKGSSCPKKKTIGIARERQYARENRERERREHPELHRKKKCSISKERKRERETACKE